jgi:hypothetical protein
MIGVRLMRSMRGALVSLLGALAGVTVGSALTSETFAAIFAPTPVVWDATACAAGIYEITSTARNTATGETFLSPVTTAKLPRPQVVQEFANLPPGTYAVTAVLRRHDGFVMPSGTQIIGGLGSGGTTFEARRRSEGRGIEGRARSRQQPPGDDRREPLGAVAPETPSVSLIRMPARPTARARSLPGQAVARDASPIEITITEAGAIFISDPDSHRVELVDMDGDGQVDLVLIEIAEETGWNWRTVSITPGQAVTIEVRAR